MKIISLFDAAPVLPLGRRMAGLLFLLLLATEAVQGQLIQISGNSTVIANGDATPSTTDNTDFGTVSTSRAITYTITNTFSGSGGGQLDVTGITSNLPGQVTISPTSFNNIPKNSGNRTFTVTFTPTGAAGARTAVITIANNSTNISSFTFTISATYSPLPVTLLRFAGRRQTAGEVRLDWQTASETNNRGFEVEASATGMVFRRIGFVEGHGTTALPQAYQFVTYQAAAQYYRFRQVDYDGAAAYSPVVFVEGGPGGLNVHPNPARSHITVSLGDGGTPVPARLLTAQGAEVWRGTFLDASTVLPLPRLAAGLYLLHVQQGGRWQFQKLVVE